MKKILTIFCALSACLTMSIVACAAENEPVTTAANESVVTADGDTTDAAAPTDNASDVTTEDTTSEGTSNNAETPANGSDVAPADGETSTTESIGDAIFEATVTSDGKYDTPDTGVAAPVVAAGVALVAACVLVATKRNKHDK